MFNFNKKEHEEMQKLEYLENEIDEILSNKKETIIGGGHFNPQFVENLNKALHQNYKTHNKNIMNLNELSKFMMSMDFVHDMVNDVNEQLTAIEGVAASSEEMSSTSMEIAQFVRDSATHAEKAMEVTDDSVNKIAVSSLTIQKSFQETEEAKKQIEKVSDETKKIDEMVAIIKSVADQTNLLALNASIEAARAGEAGKGFAVVADEIKKLAENTKESVEFIQNSVRSLRLEIAGSVKAIDLASHTFSKGMIEIKVASDAVEDTYKATESIKNNMMQISESIEQQTAATEEVASNMTEISHSTNKLNRETLRTGQAFYDISEKIINSRNNMISLADDISDEESLNLSITDHLNWIWEIYNLGLGFNEINVNEVGNHHECRLGKWIESRGSDVPKLKKHLIHLEKPHSELHELARRAVIAYNSGDSHLGDQLLIDLSNISREVVRTLEGMKKI